MKNVVEYIASAVIVVGASTLAQAQHSYLPAADTTTEQITTLTEVPDTTPPVYERDRVMRYAFTRPDPNPPPLTPSTTPGLAFNAVRAGGTSAFTQAHLVDDDSNPETPMVPNPNFQAGTSPLAAERDLRMRFQVLSYVSGESNVQGGILYWDGEGETPNFVNAPAHTTIALGKLSGDELTPKTVVSSSTDSMAPFVYDTSLETGDRSGHFHYQYDVVGEDIAPDQPAPDGFYLVGHTLSMDGFESSELILQVLLKKSDPATGLPFSRDIAPFDELLLPVEAWLNTNIHLFSQAATKPPGS